MVKTRQAVPSNSNFDASSKSLDESTVAGAERKADANSSSESKRGSKDAAKKQKTIEQTMFREEHTQVPTDAPTDAEITQVSEALERANNKNGDTSGGQKIDDAAKDESQSVEKTGEEKPASATVDPSDTVMPETNGHEADASGPIEKSSQRAKAMPSNILEKGIIYFFTRKRVGVDDAESAADLQRTYFVMRPLAIGSKLGDGAIEDSKTNRLMTLPKKIFPKSSQDKFMAFVEKANTSIQELKEEFFQASEYSTQTVGTRHVHPINTVGEGVYAITRVKNSTHLVYMLTIPSELGEVQEELGLKSQGSFAICVKNPTRKGPANASLPQGPDFPKEIIEEFRGLAWTEVKPNYLDYENAQILLMGHSNNSELGKAVEPTSKDQKNDDKETPLEEIEKLGHEDELRVQHLHGDDSVFDDLKMSKEEYPKIPTTW